jgi:hypothetical protein
MNNTQEIALRNKHKIGRATWIVFHSYPYTIARETDCYQYTCKDLSIRFIVLVEMIFDLFPCEMCRDDMKKMRDEEVAHLCQCYIPNDVRACAEAYALWAFHFHNKVNRKIKGLQLNDDERHFLHLAQKTNREILDTLDVLYNIVY